MSRSYDQSRFKSTQPLGIRCNLKLDQAFNSSCAELSLKCISGHYVSLSQTDNLLFGAIGHENGASAGKAASIPVVIIVILIHDGIVVLDWSLLDSLLVEQGREVLGVFDHGGLRFYQVGQ